MSTIKKNAIANFTGRAWGIISIYIFVPLYLKLLGIEAYGLVGFYSMLLSVLAIADIGLSATLNREMARLIVREDSVLELRDLLRTYEIVYLCISIFVALGLWITAPAISNNWLRVRALQSNDITLAIRIMGIAIALQLPSGLFSGGLFGLQKQVLANILQASWSAVRGFGAVLILQLVSPTIIAFALWQLFSNAVYFIAVRTGLWYALPGRQGKPRFRLESILSTWKYSAGMAGVACLSMILLQTDKLVVSGKLPLDAFGYYMLAAAFASAPLILAGPIGVAIFPRLTGLVAIGDQDLLTNLYHKACALVSIAVVPSALILSIFSSHLIYAWTGSNIAAEHVGMTSSLLIIGQAMQAVTVIPFYLALAHGKPKLILLVQVVSVVIIVPLLIMLIPKMGILGGGLSWLIMNVSTVPAYMYFLHRMFMKHAMMDWILRDTARPLVASLPIVMLGKLLVPMPSSRILIFLVIGIMWFVSTTAATLSLPGLLSKVLNKMKE